MNTQQLQPLYIKLLRKNTQIILPIFRGTLEPEVEEWIAELEALFEIHGIADDERVVLAANALSGTARLWLSRTISKGTKLIIKFHSESWNTFKKEIGTSFSNPNREVALKGKLKALKQQDSSIYNHVMNFREVAALLPDCPESEKIQIFRQSCTSSSQDPETDISTLEGAFEAALHSKSA